MHPNRAFEWTDRAAMLKFAEDQSFAHIFTASAEGLFVVHAPVLVTAAGTIWFHVSRRNRIAGQLEGQSALISITGRNAYQSASWYLSENQVPSWLYEAVEIEGPATKLSQEQLVELLDCLSDRHEKRHSPDRPWTRAKMAPGKFEAMAQAVVGFEVQPSDIRGTRKFDQHKSAEDRVATAGMHAAAGRDDIVAAMGDPASRE